MGGRKGEGQEKKRSHHIHPRSAGNKPQEIEIRDIDEEETWPNTMETVELLGTTRWTEARDDEIGDDDRKLLSTDVEENPVS